MERTRFEEPVRILVGLGMPRDIETPLQAYTFLSETPSTVRSVDHRMAHKVCLAALEGRVDAETARSAFVTYARRAGILMPELDDVVAAQGSAAGSGRLSA